MKVFDWLKDLFSSLLFWAIVAGVVLLVVLLSLGCYLDTSEEHQHLPPTEPPPPIAGDDDDDAVQCVASFTYSVTPGTMAASFRGEGQPRVCTEYRWDFGDGTGSSRDQNPVHTFPAAGSYTTRMTVCAEPNFQAVGCDDASAVVIIP